MGVFKWCVVELRLISSSYGSYQCHIPFACGVARHTAITAGKQLTGSFCRRLSSPESLEGSSSNNFGGIGNQSRLWMCMVDGICMHVVLLCHPGTVNCKKSTDVM